MAGKFVVFEGIDGAGTTTLTRLVVHHFKSLGRSVQQSAEPTATALGVEIRRMLAMPIAHEPNLLAALALCFAADRMQHVHQTIGPAIRDNDFIVLDRYVLSSMVYQGLHLPTSFVKEINRYAIKPDLVLVLDLDPALAVERLGERARRDFYEAPELLAQLRTRYLHFAEENSFGDTVIVDASGSVEQVLAHCLHVIDQKFFTTRST